MGKEYNVLKAKRRWQWEVSSGSPYQSQSNNCGPTCVAMIAGFYNDNTPGIEATRRMVAACCRGTTYAEQVRMLTARGVAAMLVNVTSVKQLHNLVDSGRRPVILALLMSRVPASVRGHSFLGWHAVVCMRGVRKNGVTGFYINDPNFSPPGGIRPDPTKGNRFYSDAVMQSAFIDNWQHWAIVPKSPKKILLEFDKGVRTAYIRSRPSMAVDARWAKVNHQGIFRKDKKIGGFGRNLNYRAVVKDSKGNLYWRVREFDRTLYVRKHQAHVI